MNHILAYSVLNEVVKTVTETTTEHYATIWSICILHGNALT